MRHLSCIVGQFEEDSAMTCDPLTDTFGRRIEYLRLSVTDRCDLRCRYCLPSDFRGFAAPAHWLDIDEIERLVRAFVSLGVQRVRLTGGEPLVRQDLPLLAERLGALPGLDDLSLSTNAVRLEALAQPLFHAGVKRLNISLDSLRPTTFKQITGGRLTAVLAGIEAARQAGFSPIRINTVVMRGVNDDEIEDLLWFCAERGFTLRLIETMPMGSAGQAAALSGYVDLQQIKQRLEQRIELIPDLLPGGGPARYFRLAGSATRIGFITPNSQHFCQTCNRVRVTVDGTLCLCLGQEHNVPLRPFLREQRDDRMLIEQIRRAIAQKPERHSFREQPTTVNRPMAITGG
jgi:GTP 3',8-cyclase